MDLYILQTIDCNQNHRHKSILQAGFERLLKKQNYNISIVVIWLILKTGI